MKEMERLIWKIPSDLYKSIKNNKDKLIVEYKD